MVDTAFDPFVQPLVYAGITLAATMASLWIARQRGILGKLSVGSLLIITALWAALQDVQPAAATFRWLAVLITSGWAIIVLYSLKKDGR
ncbi:MAG: hypothetical protein QOE90_2404 [Thermoplasmata archaeon]|nr:hypothetical protein [Thermoplasmata archaeon]